MEVLGWNPNNGEAVVQESYPGEYKEKVEAWRVFLAQYETEQAARVKICEDNGHDMRDLNPPLVACRNCGRIEKHGEHIGTLANDDPQRLPPPPMIPHGAAREWMKGRKGA